MGLGVIVIANDFTALNVALPAMEQDFDVDVGTIQWTVNAYVLVFGMGLVTGGRLADMLGRRKIFFIGTAIFAAFSLVGALAPNAPVLIGARVGMGVGGALMWPAVLGMTFAALPPARAGLAGGLVLGVAGLGNALGPADRRRAHRRVQLAGDLLAQPPGRRVRGRSRPRSSSTSRRSRRPSGGSTTPGSPPSRAGWSRSCSASTRRVDWGWTDARVLAMFALGIGLLAAFAVIERRVGEAALIPPDVIANRPFRAACLTVLMLSAVFFSIVLYVPQLMEKVLGFSALKAGVGMLPMLGLFAVVAFLAGRALRAHRRPPGDHRRHRPARRRPAGGLVLRRRLRLRRRSSPASS